MMQVAFNIGKPVDPIDYVIRFFTGTKCYHCELVFSDGRSFSSDPKSNGTRYKRIDYSDTEKWHLIPLPWITPQEESIIQSFCNRELGCKYDWKAVFLGWLITPCNDLSRWYCCEVCHSGIKPFLKYAHDRWYNPQGLMDELLTECFWQNKLSQK